VAAGKKKGGIAERRSSVRFYRDARCGGSEREREQSRGQAQSGGRRRRARRGGVAAARDRLLDVERRGEDSRGGVAVGEGAGRRVEGGAELQGGAPGRAGAAVCSRGEVEGIGSGEDEGDPVVKSRKFRDLTVIHI
jgi:hypothetical protein